MKIFRVSNTQAVQLKDGTKESTPDKRLLIFRHYFLLSSYVKISYQKLELLETLLERSELPISNDVDDHRDPASVRQDGHEPKEPGEAKYVKQCFHDFIISSLWVSGNFRLKGSQSS